MIDALSPWGLETLERHNDKNIPGSPERAVSRSVIEDSENRLWLMERIAGTQVEKRTAIAENLLTLQKSGMDWLLPYQETKDGQVIAEVMGFPWQLSPFYDSDELPRPEYVFDAERGAELAKFITQLREHTKGKEMKGKDQSFALINYARELAETVKDREPTIYKRLEPICARLFPKMEDFPKLPKAFCHGDFHPLNVLWKGKTIGAVIDWEFSGMRPEIYDVANMIGCVAFENPGALSEGLIPAFMDGLYDNTDISDDSYESLPAYIPSLRFAWLSEWLRKKDSEMIEMELEFMELLLAVMG
ncbi:phosphotransferase [Maridesulfovibrio salexigens]|uniref:Aminoglycoside phosphotransferase n=1 Tax=Maridesulfovibrio salexigens (strain ATCC 14822 / DSM 2638 / NCIMB 8403 / VKM B-1763) TaxID=526222 RepID=C6BW76_MARSD|nr:phosphotransferase [Maridesulfovibrio salexigens]ACS78320.1 aminoglycoside phosphotransferase [Maridesulfovibrio salexigens DSM 2638]